MIRHVFCAAALLVVMAASARSEDLTVHLNPPSVGPVTASTQLAELKRKGLDIRVMPLPVGEGRCRWGTLLYPDEPTALEIFWRRAERSGDEFDCDHPPEPPANDLFDKPIMVRISHPQSAWQTQDGIRVGTQLEEIEKAYGTVRFGGFDWDYGGGCCFYNEDFPERLSLVLNYKAGPPKALEEVWQPRISGEQGVDSATLPPELKAAMQIHVQQMLVHFVEPDLAVEEAPTTAEAPASSPVTDPAPAASAVPTAAAASETKGSLLADETNAVAPAAADAPKPAAPAFPGVAEPAAKAEEKVQDAEKLPPAFVKPAEPAKVPAVPAVDRP